MILGRPTKVFEEKAHAMTAVQLIDPETVSADQLAEHNPDLLRDVVSSLHRAIFKSTRVRLARYGVPERTVLLHVPPARNPELRAALPGTGQQRSSLGVRFSDAPGPR
ncbi:hypothetical protein [Nocardia sp. NPDC005366]|uniref:hypothetical protein n=1 Tax=Nocardia sp. NPDC005366 TaxID=3156878 RepID=UPI0033A4E764